MKILLINSSFGKRYDSRKTVTLAMYYLGAILRDKGHTIHIINPDDYIDGMVGESLASVIIEKFKDFDLFAFSSNTFTWGYVKKCIPTLKVNNIKNPIVVGGIHPSRVFNHIMQTTDIDYILIGEGDKSFPILVETLERKKNLSEVPNLVYRNDKGDIMINSFMDKMTFAKPFGDMLKEKRKLRGLSQMGLAMKSGRSLRCIQYLEAGTQEPTLSTLYALAHALDLRVMDLIEALPEELNDMYN